MARPATFAILVLVRTGPAVTVLVFALPALAVLILAIAALAVATVGTSLSAPGAGLPTFGASLPTLAASLLDRLALLVRPALPAFRPRRVLLDLATATSGNSAAAMVLPQVRAVDPGIPERSAATRARAEASVGAIAERARRARRTVARQR